MSSSSGVCGEARIIKREVKRMVGFAPKTLRKKPIGNFWNTLWIKHRALDFSGVDEIRRFVNHVDSNIS
jgi:hypothetical protein